MYKKYSVLIIVMIIATICVKGFSPEAQSLLATRIAYEVISKTNDDNFITLYLRLVVRNASADAIYNVELKAIALHGATVDDPEHYLGDIASEAQVTTPDVITISFDYAVQEPPDIVWQVTYEQNNQRIHEVHD